MPAAARLHTARSRNDQVATDLKLYTRAACAEILAAIDRARVALCRRARQHAATLLPGNTHLQRAPLLEAHPAGVRVDMVTAAPPVVTIDRGACA